MNGELLDYIKLLDAIDTMLFVISMDGHILACNSAVNRRLGYDRHGLIGANITSLHPEGSTDEISTILGCLVTQDETLCCLPIIDVNGKYVEVETRIYKGAWEGQTVLFGLSTDVTEQRMTARKCEAVFQYSPIPILVSRVSDGLIIDANGSWQSVVGYSKDEVIGRTTLDLDIWVDPSDRARLIKLLEERLDIYGEPVQFRNRRGDTIYGLLSAAQITLDGEHLWITSLVDQTEQHLLEQQLDEIRHISITTALDALERQMSANKFIKPRKTANAI
jgi:PAS domain S-box-containing protein